MYRMKLEVELSLDDVWRLDKPEDRAWLLQHILGGKLALRSDTTGDTIGKVKVLKHREIHKDVVVQADVCRGGAA